MSNQNNAPVDREKLFEKYRHELRIVTDCQLHEHGISHRRVEAEHRACLLAELLGIKDLRPLWDRL